MAKSSANPQRSFAGGEQSPLLDARADLARWATSLKTCQNFVTLVQGGATRRSGTQDVYAAQDNSDLLTFSFGAADGYAVEVAPAPGKLRFFRDFGILIASGTTPYEIDSPFDVDDIPNLYGAQAQDKLYIATGNKPIQELARLAQTDWTIGATDIRNGPFRAPNLDQTQFLYTSATGELTISRSIDLHGRGCAPFDAGQVGGLFRIHVPDTGKYGTWGTGIGYTIGDIVIWNGNWYKCVATIGDHTGTQPPVHLYGTAWDGSIVGDSVDATQWLFLHSGFGVVQITAFSSASSVTATVVSYVPSDLQGTSSANGTWRWEEGCWSAYRGFPRIIAFHKKRLYALGNTSQPTTGWASVIDDYSNFDDSATLATNAFAFDMEAQAGDVNFPQWIVSGKRLGIGTGGNEFVVTSADVTSPITPASVDPESATTEGSAAVPAVNIDGPVFVSKDGKRVHVLEYDFSQDDFIAPDLTINADHISGPGLVGIKKLAWLRDPYRLICALRSDGVLATCTYRKDQNVAGWHRQVTPKGTIETICSAPSPSGIRQDLWMIVTRTLAGGTARRVESLMPFFERGDLTSQGAWFVDGGLQYSGEPATVIHGLPPHYIGESVLARADGRNLGPFTVTDHGDGTGQIVLDIAASLVTVGLGFSSVLTTLRYDQRLQGRNGRVASVTVDAINAGNIRGFANNNDAQLLMPQGRAPVDSGQPLTTGVLGTDDPLPSEWNDDGNFTLICDDTGPATIRAITPHMLVAV